MHEFYQAGQNFFVAASRTGEVAERLIAYCQPQIARLVSRGFTNHPLIRAIEAKDLDAITEHLGIELDYDAQSNITGFYVANAVRGETSHNWDALDIFAALAPILGDGAFLELQGEADDAPIRFEVCGGNAVRMPDTALTDAAERGEVDPIPATITIRMGGRFAAQRVEYDSTYYHLYRGILGFAGAIGNSEDGLGEVYSLVLYCDEQELERDWAQHVARAHLARLHGYTPDSEEEWPTESIILSGAEQASLGEKGCLLCTRHIGLATCIELLTNEDAETRERVRNFFTL